MDKPAEKLLVHCLEAVVERSNPLYDIKKSLLFFLALRQELAFPNEKFLVFTPNTIIDHGYRSPVTDDYPN